MKWRPYWCTVRELALSYSNISYCFTTPLGPPITWVKTIYRSFAELLKRNIIHRIHFILQPLVMFETLRFLSVYIRGSAMKVCYIRTCDAKFLYFVYETSVYEIDKEIIRHEFKSVHQHIVGVIKSHIWPGRKTRCLLLNEWFIKISKWQVHGMASDLNIYIYIYIYIYINSFVFRYR